ncbi:iron-containing alcohol dehydrogenase [Methylocaldum szegediense]|uniref:Alcohol dehydrogenase n=1 Tax=Methylocaldum szegediense TaxID=73780 RepID=A0ABM9I811_9GAMM|nr:iron-containing alcohol dehydrogenase [Methylocaldum szegediense]CAI8951531.1 Alcohol dehydrogenase [Methylocaldum szegediense]
MTIPAFSISRLPRILFGSGQLAELPKLARSYGEKALLVTGVRSFRASPRWTRLTASLAELGMSFEHMTVSDEPTPQLVDGAVAAFRGQHIDLVVAIGGGSVLDAAKAIAGLLPHGNSVMDHLEGVGRNIPYTGPATPFIAVPTTAGTGSEATKNAVLSVRGEQGFKKSFRHECLVPEYAIVDPDLLATCPPDLIAADGMDAFTQLLESYVSARANPMTDALAKSGMEAFRDGFFAALQGGDNEEARAGRSAIAYASLMSGITLAQAGLGSVHGLAAPLGAFYPIPHGLACGTLLAEATAVNVHALQERAPEHPALKKYAGVAELLTGHSFKTQMEACNALVAHLHNWTERLALKRLGHFGVEPAHVPKIVANARGTSMQTNPVTLTDGEIGEILLNRI